MTCAKSNGDGEWIKTTYVLPPTPSRWLDCLVKFMTIHRFIIIHGGCGLPFWWRSNLGRWNFLGKPCLRFGHDGGMVAHRVGSRGNQTGALFLGLRSWEIYLVNWFVVSCIHWFNFKQCQRLRRFLSYKILLKQHCPTCKSAVVESSFFSRTLKDQNWYKLYRWNHESLFFFFEDLFSGGDLLDFRRRDLWFLLGAGSKIIGNSLCSISEDGTDYQVCLARVLWGASNSGEQSVTSSTCCGSSSNKSAVSTAFKEGCSGGDGISSSLSCWSCCSVSAG